MKKSNKFSPEVHERAAMLHEHKGEYPSLWAAVESIAPKIGCVPQTLLECEILKLASAFFAQHGAELMRADLAATSHEQLELVLPVKVRLQG